MDRGGHASFPGSDRAADARLIADHNFRSRRICRTDRQHERRAVETEIRTTSAAIVLPASPVPIPPDPVLPQPPAAEPEPEAVLPEATVSLAKPVNRSRVPAVRPRRSGVVAEPARELPAAHPSVSEPLPLPDAPAPPPAGCERRLRSRSDCAPGHHRPNRKSPLNRPSKRNTGRQETGLSAR